MPALVTNNATSTLASGIDSAVTSLSVAAGEGARFPSPSSPDYFYCTLAGSAGIEIVKVTARATDTFTIVRAQDGTTAKSFTAGETVELRPVAALFDIDTLLPDQTSAANKVLVSNGTVASWSSNLSGLTLASPTVSTLLTVLGNINSSGTLAIAGGSFPGVATTEFFANSTRFGLIYALGAANTKAWDFAVGATTLEIRAVNDADTTATSFITMTRTATAATSVAINATQILIDNGVEATPAFAFGSDATTGLWTTGTDNISFSAGGLLAFGITAGEVRSILPLFSDSTVFASALAATTAGGAAATGFYMGTAGIRVTWGSGAPTLSAPQGSLYLRTDGSSTSTRAYINTNGSTGWTAITTAT
jgi:hypothetical protein